MTRLFLALFAITGALANPREKEKTPVASRSFLSLVQEAMRQAVDKADYIYRHGIADMFAAHANRSVDDGFAWFPCNLLCYVCWKSTQEDLMTQCEDHCEAACRWNYQGRSGDSARKRNLVELCVGFLGSVNSDGGGGAGLLGGLTNGLLGGLLGGGGNGSNSGLLGELLGGGGSGVLSGVLGGGGGGSSGGGGNSGGLLGSVLGGGGGSSLLGGLLGGGGSGGGGGLVGGLLGKKREDSQYDVVD